MLSLIELENLLDTLSQTETTLENCFQSFSKQFGSEFFKPCFVLVELLTNNFVTKKQRLVSLFLLLEAYPPRASPFVSFLVETCDKTQDLFEKKFIYQIMVTGKKDSYDKEQLKILFQKAELFNESFKLKEDYEQFKRSLIEIQPKIFQGFTAAEISNVIPDFNLEDNKYSPPGTSISADKIKPNDIAPAGFTVDFIRPIPKKLPLMPNEMTSLNPLLINDLCWDYTLSCESDCISNAKDLVQKACRTNLSPTEMKFLLESFEKDNKLVYNCGISPSMLPDLVEKNTALASSILTYLHQYNQINMYFEKIVNLELSLSSLEVVNKLANACELPKEFLHYFITKCIMQCEDSKKDKTLQNRLIRLVCAFIKSMIKNKIINPTDMFIELQAFCIEYTKVPEASTLFKMLKAVESTATQNPKDENAIPVKDKS